jgi:hypothetical protein
VPKHLIAAKYFANKTLRTARKHSALSDNNGPLLQEAMSHNLSE